MKTVAAKRPNLHAMPDIPYPNAATKQELLHRVLDLLLVAAIGAGLAASLIFLLVLA